MVKQISKKKDNKRQTQLNYFINHHSRILADIRNRIQKAKDEGIKFSSKDIKGDNKLLGFYEKHLQKAKEGDTKFIIKYLQKRRRQIIKETKTTIKKIDKKISNLRG
jgi:sugar-specific transcriptional regulator TrmB